MLTTIGGDELLTHRDHNGSLDGANFPVGVVLQIRWSTREQTVYGFQDTAGWRFSGRHHLMNCLISCEANSHNAYHIAGDFDEPSRNIGIGACCVTLNFSLKHVTYYYSVSVTVVQSLKALGNTGPSQIC